MRHVQEPDYKKLHSAEKNTTHVDRSYDENTLKNKAKKAEDVGERKLRTLPCRVLLKARGVEWLIYNRSPAFDAIFRSMNEVQSSEHITEDVKLFESRRTNEDCGDVLTGAATTSCEEHQKESVADARSIDDTKSSSRLTSNSSKDSEAISESLPGYLNLLPIGIECGKGAVVMGNRNTQSVLTAKFESAVGKIDAKESAPLDRYKQIFDLDFTHPIIEFKPNKDYIEPQTTEGAKLHSNPEYCLESRKKPWWPILLKHRDRLRSAWDSLFNYIPYRRGSTGSFTHPQLKSTGPQLVLNDTDGAYVQSRWLGLTRYLDDEDGLVEQERWKAVEYGQFPTIVDSPLISMNLYWDVPGLVPVPISNISEAGTEACTDINGQSPPDWGIALKIGGGTIHYGPWADRQRSNLQAVFFPSLMKDTVPALRIVPGQPRVSTVLKVLLEIEEQTTLRIPTREESKDWKWRGHKVFSDTAARKTKRSKHHAKASSRNKNAQISGNRPSGWLDVKVLSNSTANFSMDLLPREYGFRNKVDLDLKGPEISSSVNHGLLWRCRSQTISCDLSNPLAWNALRQWKIDIHDDGMELFILRDHMFLLTDLISDWTSGPPGDFYTFIPFQYMIKLHFGNFKLYLNANDSNVINNPSDLDDNTFVILGGKHLAAELCIHQKIFRPARSQMSFEVNVNDSSFHLRTPPRNTQHTFLKSSDVASLESLGLHGSYDYFTGTSPSLTDILFMTVNGLSPKIALYGFLVRYFMKIKDNYFGDDIHFRTLDEYKHQISRSAEEATEEAISTQHSRNSNDLDVILSISAEQCAVLLPTHLYSSDENVRLEVVSVTSDLRITNYYMDLAISSSPIAVSRTSGLSIQKADSDDYDKTEIFVDGLQISGHRLFGLPLAEPTYVCNWDFGVGRITGECSITFTRYLIASIRCFGLTFDDSENAMPSLQSSIIHDVTFFRMRLQSVLLGLRVEQAAFLISTGEIQLDFNDWAGALFSDQFHILVPDLILAIADSQGPLTNGLAQSTAYTHAYLRTTIELNGVGRKKDFEADRQSQQTHLALHDTRTHRVPWLIHDHGNNSAFEAAARLYKTRPPAMPFPPMPDPLSTSISSSSASEQSSMTSLSTITQSSKSTHNRKPSFLLGPMQRSGSSHESKKPHWTRDQGLNELSRSDKGRIHRLSPRELLETPFGESFSSRETDNARLRGSDVSFSSPYKTPYFPLLATAPMESSLPDLPDSSTKSPVINKSSTLDDPEAQYAADSGTARSNVIVSFKPGVRVFCNAQALFLVSAMVTEFQQKDAEALLDDLQIDSLTDVLEARKKDIRKSQTKDIRILIPGLVARFLNASDRREPDSSSHDCYEVYLDHLTTTTRLARGVSEVSQSADMSLFSIHLSANQMRCSARETASESADDQAIISISLNELVFWMSQGARTAAEVQFDELELASASKKVSYISSLLRKTLALYEDLAARFTKLERDRRSRLRSFVFLLCTEGHEVPDPPFLTRVSYVLRSASHHLRTSDSWKIMSRLRYIHDCLSEQTQNSIFARSTESSASCPNDVGQRIISSLLQWQPWDLAQLRSSLLMQRVYGTMLEQRVSESKEVLMIKGALRAGAIRVVVSPGPKQNETAIKGLIIGVTTNDPRTSSLSSLQDSAGTRLSTMEVHCAELALRLNWTLVGLVENVIDTVRSTTRRASQNPNTSMQSTVPLVRDCLHIVLSSDMCILNCDTPHIKFISICKDLKTSILIERHHARLVLTSTIFHADALTSEVKTLSIVLSQYKLRQPMLFGTKVKQRNQEMWKIVGFGRDVFFQVFANPIQLVETADDFLEHEVSHIITRIKTMQSAQVPAQAPSNGLKQTEFPKFEVALSLESYLISLGILPSLTYQINGTQSRSSVRLSHLVAHGLGIEFGLHEHTHIFKARSQYSESFHVLSTLNMPPINGELMLHSASGQKMVSFQSLVDDIGFDASALHAILSAINRPEIVSFMDSLQNEVSIFRKHYERIFDTNQTNKEIPSIEPVVYDANFTISSLAIHARTSDSISVAQGAELLFKISGMQLKARNRDRGSTSAMTFPELDLLFKGLTLDLLRFDENELLPCGNVAVKAFIRSASKVNDAGRLTRSHEIESSSLQINVYAETAPVIVAILVHLQDTLKTIDLDYEMQNLKLLGRKRLRSETPNISIVDNQPQDETVTPPLFNAMYSLRMSNVCVIWRVGHSAATSPNRGPENLMLSITRIDLATKRENAARLLIESLQLQLAQASQTSTTRSSNSALLPEVLFNVAFVSTAQDRRLAFQAAGKSLDLRLTSQFILPANDLRRSIALSLQQVRLATSDWKASASVADGQNRRLMGNKRLASLLIDAEFGGAVVHMQGRQVADPHSLALNVLRGGHVPQHGRYNQFTPENASNSSTTLRAPGIAFKVEYRNKVPAAPSLNAEIKVDASSNTLYPTVVPLILEISSTVKDIVGEPTERENSISPDVPQPGFLDDQRLRGADPAAIFGSCKLNLGLRICRQEFSLSCQPVARVAATARFDDIYITVNTVQMQTQGKFFAVSGTCANLQASVQHVYSRESTGNFEVDSIVLSLVNSKHVSSANGISAILKISPMKAQINGKQSQDFLLFREIWLPPEIHQSGMTAPSVPASESQAFIVQRYQQVAAAGAFPWNATVFLAELEIQVDLGQSLGKSAFAISQLWISSKKRSDWEHNLCLGFDKMVIDAKGRMSGFVELLNLRIRTSIQWPVIEKAHNQTPLVQASLAFGDLRVKAAFDFQAFAIAAITKFEFLMYNVRDLQNVSRDRLVGVLEGEEIMVFCTTTSASQSVALYQAFQRLYEEKQAAYRASLRDIEKFLRRKSSINPSAMRSVVQKKEESHADDGNDIRSSLKLQTDVVVTLKAVNIGAFPSTFFDNQVFKLEAFDASARFVVIIEDDKIHSTLGMNLGQLRIALAGITESSVSRTVGDISVADVVASATASRGGTILKVPKLIATMETWQIPDTTNIDYIFKSSFQGRVDVGWNYSRISYIRGMWTNHTRALAQRLGKPLPKSAVQITGGPRPEGDQGSQSYAEGEQNKITAVVNVPQSRYQYTALQPPVIETPQLRDMGEATPPLEWIGLHRERLPNLTHQIVIVGLLEVAKEVDDAYSKILGSS